MGKIAEEEKIKVSGSEVDTEIENMLEDVKERREELLKFLNTPQRRSSIENLLATQKTIRHLVKIAEGSKTNTKVQQKEEPK